MSQRPKALIAGSGVAGIAAAVQLDSLGYAVTLIERKPILGGRTYSFTDSVTGTTIDNGQHLLAGAYHETFSLLERIGSKHTVKLLKPSVVPLYRENGKRSEFVLGATRPPLNLLKALFGFSGFSWSDCIRFLHLGLKLIALRKKDVLPDDQTVTQWLKQLGQSEAVRRDFWEVLTLATLNDHPDMTTVDGLLQVLLKSYFAGPNDGYLVLPQAGLSDVFANPAQRYLEMRGHRILQKNALREIRIIDNQVQGFVLADGEIHKADVYVSALPFRQILQVLPPALVDSHAQLKPLRAFQSSPIISINLFFDQPVMDDAFAGSSKSAVHWFFNKGNHVVGVMSGAYDYLDASKEALVKMALHDLRVMNPAIGQVKLKHALVNKEREATLSSRLGINAQRPQQRILKNFFVIGDWTKTGLPATIESAAVSAKKMVELL